MKVIQLCTLLLYTTLLFSCKKELTFLDHPATQEKIINPAGVVTVFPTAVSKWLSIPLERSRSSYATGTFLYNDPYSINMTNQVVLGYVRSVGRKGFLYQQMPTTINLTQGEMELDFKYRPGKITVTVNNLSNNNVVPVILFDDYNYRFVVVSMDVYINNSIWDNYEAVADFFKMEK
jgi:hypothetical protein